MKEVYIKMVDERSFFSEKLFLDDKVGFTGMVQ